ncbi:hypothetical protein [Methanoculleus chikugoensis]|uniref:hypothetical protein n=1 Tax=Methanoculleus chikugoensis TaxID=118126 RepID=UPI001FB28034|nr:hypothetical protein [Methanoculleus chikugoensis]
MPIPVSLTETTTTSCSRAASMVIVPFSPSMYLTALAIRLLKISPPRRTRSALTVVPGGMLFLSEMAFVLKRTA